MISPACVHRHAGFPRAGARFRLDALFRRREIALELVAIVDEDVGLELEDHLVHLLRLPSLRIERPGDVVPEDVHFAVVRHQLADLAVDVVDEAPARGLVALAARAVGVVPVHQRVVEADA